MPGLTRDRVRLALCSWHQFLPDLMATARHRVTATEQCQKRLVPALEQLPRAHCFAAHGLAGWWEQNPETEGQALSGSHRYRLHFTPAELPPVNAFWSITAYGSDNFLIDNRLRRYAIGDRDPLVYNPDGSLDVWIQADEPAAGKSSNWLPVKVGQPFLLNARLYWPKPAALNGVWGMPAVERVD